MARKNEREIIYEEELFKMGIRLYECLEIPLDIIYHLLRNKRIRSFSAMVIQSDFEEFGTFLEETKRKTDYLFPIDEKKGVYAMLCQETQVDGGFYFIKRLDKHLKDSRQEHEIRAAIVGVESTHYSVRDLIFFVLDTYIKVLNDEENSVSFRTIR